MTVGPDTYVYPDAALPYIASGALDEQLFNVSGLLKDGYDDARSDRLPLIVTYTDAAARSRAAKTPDGARKTLTLSSIQGAAISADHATAAGFWSSLTGSTPAPAAGARSDVTSAPSQGRLAGGIAKVWLDGKVTATLADTTAQIGAPAVWAGGDTGQGVDVAVLDTGIDAAHPDFAGRIAAAESFVPGQDVTDRHGHGTHVASTVAGTGAASGGREKGVAPGASLHIGKVLDNSGSGQDSWILAGMEWAARTQHAKVVSMSLGGGPTDGTDPLSQAVDHLSKETGALFVIAAGNSGPEAYTVSAPGAADAALTVGAVHGPGKGVDQLAEFSSRGPRVGDNAIKPDLTAPGVDVLAARSQYAPEGEGAYQTMSGTSMATPHVAGAAALLAAAHPDWTGQQLKDALVSTTSSTQRFSPFQAGSGRIDIAAAVKSTLFASGSAFAQTRYPYTPGQTVRKDVTYTNTAAAPVTLDLSLGQDQLPEGLFTLTDSRLTVPAHGTRTVGVISHLDAAADNAAYSSRLTAAGSDGTVLARTSVGLNKEGQRVTLSVTAKDRRGAALPGHPRAEGRRAQHPAQGCTRSTLGRTDLRLPPSTYAAWCTPVPGIDGTHTLGSACSRHRRSTSMPIAPSASTPPTCARRPPYPAAERRPVHEVGPVPRQRRPVPVHGQLHARLLAVRQPLGHADAEGDQGLVPLRDALAADRAAPDVLLRIPDLRGLTIQSLSPKLPEGTGTYRAVWAADGSAADFRTVKVRGQVAVVPAAHRLRP